MTIHPRRALAATLAVLALGVTAVAPPAVHAAKPFDGTLTAADFNH